MHRSAAEKKKLHHTSWEKEYTCMDGIGLSETCNRDDF